MTYYDVIGDMWLDIWGNSVLAGIAILAVFAFACCRKKLNLPESVPVMVPVIIGLVADGAIPWYLEGLVYIGFGTVWALAIMKLVGLRT